ncbi:ABC transporter permease subunit [Longivirga aurantiaca]|uniref:ABC transporter permease subunit n=1 Tax=Longivirga aurantiaca TaxID=1837743 RepID=A0ABW1T2X2_9ACTN
MSTREALTSTAEQLVAPAPGPGRQALLIAQRALAERSRSLVVWSVGVAAITAVQLAVYPSIATTAAGWQQMLDAWPEAFRAAFDLDAYTTGPGFLNAELFSMIVPLVLVAVALGSAAAATAAEEERGTADLLLALPVARTTVLLAKALAMVVSVVAVAAVAAVTVAVGAPLVDLDVSTAGILAGCAMVTLLALLVGAAGLVLGALTGHRAAVLGGGIGLALTAFLVDALAPMADWLEPWQDASPFAWALRSDPLTSGFAVLDALLLASVALVLTGAAVAVYRRRDIDSR